MQEGWEKITPGRKDSTCQNLEIGERRIFAEANNIWKTVVRVKNRRRNKEKLEGGRTGPYQF